MDTDNQGLQNEAKDIIREFVVKKMLLLLTDPNCEQKIKEDHQILQKLGIRLLPEDITPFITAVSGSGLIDNENKLVKDELAIKRFFAILGELFMDTPMLTYYNLFSKVKLDQLVFGDYSYVLTALKIIEHSNWDNDSPNTEMQIEVRDYFLNTIFSTGLGGEDKIYNLNILQDELKIALTEEEKTLISKHLKQDIMQFVDLIDQMRKTSFGANPLPAGKISSSQAAPGEASAGQDENIGKEEKKGFLDGIFSKK